MADRRTTFPDLSARVDAELRDIVDSRDMPLYGMMSYHMGWTEGQGRAAEHPVAERTHGVLCLLAAEAAGGDMDTAIPAAAAIELVTNFCEIHDDVQEGRPERNGRDAVWWVWGPAQAINAGDGMHALARLALFRLQDRGVSAQTTFRAVQLLDRFSLQACEGRFLELEARERIDMGVDDYLRVAALKAGSLLSCAMMLGAASHEKEDALESLSRCGESLGVAVEIDADVRSLWDGEAGPTAEAMNKTKMLPVVLALEKATVSQKRALGEIYFKRVLDGGDVAKVRGIVDDMGVREECEALVSNYRAAALAALDSPGISAEGRAALAAYVDSLLG
jgi:geranylgeranyl diphosphate synthase type I